MVDISVEFYVSKHDNFYLGLFFLKECGYLKLYIAVLQMHSL